MSRYHPSGHGSYSSENFVFYSSGNKSLRYIDPRKITVKPSSIAEDFSKSIKVLGGYSEDEEKNISLDKSSLSFLNKEYLPDEETRKLEVNFNLKKYVETVKNYTGTPKKGFENFLSWIVNNSEAFSDEMKSSRSSEGQFVLLRNVLSSMMRIPYKFGKKVCLEAISINKITFITKIDQFYQPSNNGMQLMSHVFEMLMTGGPPEDSKELYCNKDFRVVLSGKLNKHRILYSCATDCAQHNLYNEDLPDTSAFVGLKTTFSLGYGSTDLYNTKMVEFYVYCQLLSIDKIIVGFRNDDQGIVDRLRLLDKKEMCAIGKDAFHPTICHAYASELLSFIKKECDKNPGRVLKFHKEERSNEVTVKMDEDADSFVPKWFLEEILNENEEEETE